ncbi:MAG: PKD domain-containing protein [Salinivirgaceae bacterium]|nr:PKD domain-containing protein [Salinivirgaceae bacterium]
MKKAVKYLIISIILLVQAAAANAQTDKEFWFCIPQLSSQHEKDVPKLVITAFENNATVHIDMPRQSAFIPITVNVPAGTSKIIMFSTKDEATTIYNYKGKTPPADAIYAGDFMKDNNQESNILESGLYGESCQIKDKGIHITSNELITAYLERGVINNDDIWALKGKNAFGKEFIVPSQNDFKNFPFGGNSQNSPNAWNSIDIVAIEDVTVTITLTDKGSDLVSLWPHGTSNKGSFKLKKGQTLSLQAKSQDASKHLGGTIITANGYIAVQWKDDSLYLQQPSLTDEYTCYDVIGDQLVPTKLAGTEYIVMRGQIGESLPSGKKKAEFVYIMAVKDGTTNVSFSTDNNDNISPITLTKRGEIKHIRLNNQLVNVLDKKNYNALHISADNPIIVMHIAGFGCEVGSAILPTINGCTGSTDVSVCRSTSEDFYLNIMCKVAHKGDFTINVNGNNYSIPDTWFKDIPNTGWCYLVREHVKFSSTNSGNGVSIPSVNTGSVVKVSNSTGLFHLAIINGGSTSGCRYGYFSDFSNNMGKAVVAGDDFNSEYDRFCVGDTVTLSSTGGWKYQWSFIPPDGVTIDNGTDDTFISTNTMTSEQMKSQREPKVKPIEGFNRYKVQIWRRCYLGLNVDTTINVWALGYPKITAECIKDQASPCSPSQVVLTNQTDEKGKLVNYVWRINDGTNTLVKKGHDFGNDTLTNNSDGTIEVVNGDKSSNALFLVNNTAHDVNYTVTLESSIEYNCPSTATKSFIVCPNVEAELKFKDNDSKVQPVDRCQPLTVNFKSLLKGPFTRINVFFGDGGNNPYLTPDVDISLNNPTPTTGYNYEVSHTYINKSVKDTTYRIKIRIVDETPGHGCESWDSLDVVVNGYVKAQYVIDKSSACSPLTTTFKNNSIGEASRMHYTWTHYASEATDATRPNAPTGATQSTTDFTLTYENNGTAPKILRGIGLKAVRTSDVGKNCEDVQLRDSLVIYPKFTVDYTVTPMRDCNPMIATFTNLSSDQTDKTQFTWYMGDGTTEKGSGPIAHTYSHTQPNIQNYTTALAGESQWGCRDSVSKATLAVMPYLNPKFTLDYDAAGCSPLTVKLKNNTPAHAYKAGLKWEITDPTGSYNNTTLGNAIQNDEATLEFVNLTGEIQTIKIKLIDEYTDVQNGNKLCSEFYEREIIIKPKITAAISADKVTMCDSTEVTFTNGSAFAGSHGFAPPTDYWWTFGDGTSTRTDNTDKIKHRYRNNSGEDDTNAKTFTASLVASANGCADTARTSIGVYPKVRAAFSYVKATECYSAQDNVVATMVNSSLSANKFEWDFDYDGNNFAADETKTDKTNFNHNYVNNSADGNGISTYTIKLKAINSNNESCFDVATKTIDIYPKVIAAFEPTANAQGCSPLTTTFTNSSKGYGLTYQWEYDHDNLQSTESGATHTHTFDNVAASTRTYNVKLTVTDANNCKSDITKQVNAYPHVVADFTYEKDAVCTPYPVTFSYPVAALNGTHFVWDFGDGTAAETYTDKQSFKHTFDNDALNSVKTYNIKLISTDLSTGCNDNITKPIEVYPQLKPAFTQDVTEGCNPLTVQFTNQTTGLADYLWDFGDSQSSAETSPKHLFRHFKLTDQTYNVVLTTTQTATGCVKTVNQPITTYSYVQAKFGINETVENSNGTEAAVVLGGCTPFDVTITDSSKLTSAGTWYWDFGDGTTSADRQPRSRVYTNDDNTYPLENKNYTISLIVTNDHGCHHDTTQTIVVYPRSVPDFDGNFTGCEPLTVEFEDKSVVDAKTQYFWTFSDGSTIVEKPPFSKIFHNYDYENSKKYTVNLKTTTEYNCTDEITKEIEVFAKPLARFIPLIDRACPPFEAEFMNTSIGTNLTYNWDYDNGQTTSTTSKDNQKVEYSNDTEEPITFNVELMVESDMGCRDTMVNPMITFPNVIVDFEFDTAGCSPHTIKVKNLSTKTTTNHLFDFGEGSSSVADEPTFTYYNTTDNDQVLTITYIGSSKYQCTDTIKKNVTVYINPNVDFVPHTPSQRYPDDTVYFENYTQDGPWTYQWDFGDGNTLRTDEKYFMYKYGKWGANKDDNIFHVTLHVETEHCENTMTHDVIILPPYPRIEILNQKPSGCVPLTVQFRINQEYCNTFEWNFEDGTTSTEPEPVHEFSEPGIYNVKLSAEGDGGSHYDYEIITVYELPEPEFTTSPKYVMLPDQPVQFFNSTRNGNTYIWDFGDGEYSTDLNPYHQYTKEGFYDVKLIAFSSQMCTDSIIKYQDVEVSGAGYIKYPNAFIPSDESPEDGTYPTPDDVDNVFHPIWHGVKEYDLWIFNRWGEQLFHSTDVNVGWNGRYANNGAKLGQDVYFWKAKGKFENNVPFKIAGDVTLIRR